MNIANLSVLLLPGSIAAAAQRLFFGAKVPKGSWFAQPQSVRMKWRVCY